MNLETRHSSGKLYVYAMQCLGKARILSFALLESLTRPYALYSVYIYTDLLSIGKSGRKTQTTVTVNATQRLHLRSVSFLTFGFSTQTTL